MLKIENVKKTYNNFQLDVSMEIMPGTIVGLVGANGAGKSTLFKSLIGLIKKDNGQIIFGDEDITNIGAKTKEKISISMTDSFFPDAFKRNDIKAIMKATYKSFDENWFDAKCQEFGLETNKKLSEYSTGMKAKMKVITALSRDSKLLILDEPTQGLDVVAREEISELVRDYIDKDEERIVIISSHISSDIEKLCDRIVMLGKGKVVLEEDTDVLMSEYAVIRVDEDKYNELDKEYILASNKEKYAYECLTDKKDYYMENYPDIVVEKTTIDDILIMMIKGEK